MLERWSILSEKVHVVHCDAGAKVKKAMQIGNNSNFDCANHQLHLVVTEALRASAPSNVLLVFVGYPGTSTIRQKLRQN